MPNVDRICHLHDRSAVSREAPISVDVPTLSSNVYLKPFLEAQGGGFCLQFGGRSDAGPQGVKALTRGHVPWSGEVYLDTVRRTVLTMRR